MPFTLRGTLAAKLYNYILVPLLPSHHNHKKNLTSGSCIPSITPVNECIYSFIEVIDGTHHKPESKEKN